MVISSKFSHCLITLCFSLPRQLFVITLTFAPVSYKILNVLLSISLQIIGRLVLVKEQRIFSTLGLQPC